MKGRNMLALIILVGGAVASFYCYTRLNQLLPMSDAAAVSKTEAHITAVNTPMVKKNQTVTEVKNDVRFAFTVHGKTYEGGYSIADRNKAPKMGAAEPVAYLTQRPDVFLRAAEYDDLPRQLKALRIMMWGFALIAMIAPFGVMKHGA
jgi:hypothetical protein